MLQTYNDLHPEITLISYFVFLIIGIVDLCIEWLPHKPSVQNELHLPSCLSDVGLVFPFLFAVQSATLFLAFLLLGMVVVADSPLLSTLVAQNAPEIKGTTLTIVNNSIGFAITIISIQLISGLRAVTDTNTIYICLAIGP
jgi:MFS family permease